MKIVNNKVSIVKLDINRFVLGPNTKEYQKNGCNNQ